METRTPTHDEILKMMRAVLIRQYRLDLKIASVKLSEKLSFHNSKLSQLENGYWAIREEHAVEILSHYNVAYVDFCKLAERLTIMLSSEIVYLRKKTPWFDLHRCTSEIFKKEYKSISA